MICGTGECEFEWFWSKLLFLVTGYRLECHYRSQCYRQSFGFNNLYCYRYNEFLQWNCVSNN